jgi:very-short-patch-repair endonuclease
MVIGMREYNKELKSFARELRKNMTDAEQVMWRHLKGKQILGLQFYRQKIIANFIVDFYCPKVSVVIEIDGGQHFDKETLKKDALRDKTLNELNIKVLRYNNLEVMENLDGVLTHLYNEMQKRM